MVIEGDHIPRPDPDPDTPAPHTEVGMGDWEAALMAVLMAGIGLTFAFIVLTLASKG